MANISADKIKELRTKTGAGIMDCKEALTEAKEDIDGAVEILRSSCSSVSPSEISISRQVTLCLKSSAEDSDAMIVVS